MAPAAAVHASHPSNIVASNIFQGEIKHHERPLGIVRARESQISAVLTKGLKRCSEPSGPFPSCHSLIHVIWIC